ncbi:hypothetical protein F5884DRAFT_76893 [Xylogone sp. PMI_703]|nr:hypothetical protein F5884DRAFT_76893 [Xylogone sp. PMI_703]
MPYRVTEPHPTVTTNHYTHSGRGGAGNTFRAPQTTRGPDATGPASHFKDGIPFNSNARFSSGRGGAGNVHYNRERTIFSFDEELQRQTTREMKEKQGGSTWHVGRGGAGNLMVAGSKSAIRKGSMSSSSSEESTGSARSGFLGRLSQTFERR